MTLAGLAEIAGWELSQIPQSAHDKEIFGLAPLGEAGPDEISFFADPRYSAVLKKSRAGVVLVPESFSGDHSAVCIPCSDPAAAFAALVPIFTPPEPTWPAGVHSSAVISPEASVAASASIQPGVVIEAGANIAEGCFIGANSYVGHGAKIGANTRVGPSVFIGPRCILGERILLHAGVIIGADGFGFQFRDGRQEKIPQTGIVQIDDDVEIGANSTVDRARFGRTRIGAGTKIDNLVQVGHNVQIGRHCILCAQVAIAGSTLVGDYVTFAGKVGVNGHIEIGSRSVLTAMSGVAADVPEGAVFGGRPAFDLADYKRNFVQLRRIHKLYDRVATLEKNLAPSPSSPLT
jgi:UDP-3-O-[3-hydroxymyristoyl] glucosamine N-acyltransferase